MQNGGNIMASTHRLKIALIGGFAVIFLAFAVFSNLPIVTGSDEVAQQIVSDDNYIGSESCKACHEDQFKSFADTKHAKLAQLESWKGKVQGCESCHGPGKDHMEGGGDKTKIISFKNKNSKEISETCLACHAGKESHNNFRRGEHWRNDVGCTECHTPHGPNHGNAEPGSISLIGDVSKQNPNRATEAMLKKSEPQLCITCHSEVKAQFSKPSHHKVLEGAMKCSDCHNAHGGTEAKQTKVTAAADAACIKCHADKQGPFVFEHAPVKTEGCSACHTPHGSNNPRMLKRNSIQQLCVECHTTLVGIEDGGAAQATHAQFAGSSPTKYMNCTVCHVKIHGSNANARFVK